jgi:hypothetical protein
MTSMRTRKPIERNISPLLAAAVAMGAAGFFIAVPAPAQAAPCSQWGFPTGGNGFTNNIGQSLLFQAGEKSVTQAAASWTGPNGTNGSGYLNGSINGTGLNFTWKGDGGPPNFKGGNTITFVGTVNSDGSAGGTVSYSNSGPGSFTSQKRMTCLDAAAAPPPPADKPAPAVKPAPAAAPVTNAIALSFGPPHLGSVTATVRNSSDLTAKCTYDASGLTNTHRDFTVGPKGSTDLTFNGFNTGTSYHAVVKCKDASGKQTQDIGDAEQDVRF